MPAPFSRFNPIKEILGLFLWIWLFYLFLSHDGPERTMDWLNSFGDSTEEPVKQRGNALSE